MSDAKKTFLWIVDILQRHEVPFMVTGGLAAKAYGSPRALNDIDIDIPADKFDLILNDIEPYIVFGPADYKDNCWDLKLCTLKHEGQDIDLSGGETVKICDARTGEWKAVPNDFTKFETKEVFGVSVPVITKQDLIFYKSMLTGDHQQIDIQATKLLI